MSKILIGRTKLVICILTALAVLLLVCGCSDNSSDYDPDLSAAYSGDEESANDKGVPVGTIGLAPNPEDGIKLTINSGENKTVLLPIGGGDPFGVTEFDWDIDWGDGTIDNETGQGSAGSTIEHEYSTGNVNYIVTIKPHDALSAAKSNNGWFQAFGWSTSGWYEYRDKFLYVDGVLDDAAINISQTYTCVNMFSGCKNLKMGPNFRFDTKGDNAGISFASGMFEDCANIVVNDKFVLPQITSDNLNSTQGQPYVSIFSGVSAQQKRTALQIIGTTMNGYGTAAPSKPIGSFSNAFDTAGVSNPNWYTK